MTKLRDLERRLEEEPENLGLRVVVAGALREAGRMDDAVELYRSVAIAYRDQGRSQQAIAVCRSILEIAPDDPRCHALLASLVAGHKSASPRAKTPSDPPPADDDLSGVPVRISAYDETPLPAALPYHVADPTQRSLARISASDLPLAEDAATRPGTEDGQLPEVSGIASAARQISATLIAAGRDPDDDDPAADLETRQRPRLEHIELDPLGPGDDDPTDPRDLPRGTRRRLPLRAPTHDDAAPAHVPPERSTPAALAFAFVAPLPAERRGAVLARFSRRSVPAGTTVIRQGEQGHPLVLVASGRLEVRVDRPASDAAGPVELGPIDTGDHVGEAALLARAPAPAHIVAATEAELLLLSPRDFYDVAGTYPALWAQLKEIAERRTREHAARLGR